MADGLKLMPAPNGMIGAASKGDETIANITQAIVMAVRFIDVTPSSSMRLLLALKQHSTPQMWVQSCWQDRLAKEVRRSPIVQSEAGVLATGRSASAELSSILTAWRRDSASNPGGVVT
jgi:hypothetical protein